MPDQSKTKVFVITVGVLFTIAGLLLLVGNQLELSAIAPAWAVIPIMSGIIIIIIGKNLRAPSSNTERLATNLYSPRAPSGLAKPATLVQPNAAAQETSLEIIMLRQNLLVKCLSNEGQVERLIEYERKIRPAATTEDLFKLAIERWERDNR